MAAGRKKSRKAATKRKAAGNPRALWKGRLLIGRQSLAVSLYSAVQDRKIHFHLLDAKHLQPVHQRIVRKSDGKEVPREEQFKALPLDKTTAVILRPEEIGKVQPEASREIEMLRFVPRSELSEQWYERPYYLGPDSDAAGYSSLAAELEHEELLGIGRWVMRGKGYVGALAAVEGRLALITLRRAEQVVSVSGIVPAASQKPDPREAKLAAQLVDSITADFDPSAWQDEYHDRVCKLIAEKARGKVVRLPKPKKKRAPSALDAALRQSLAALKERKVA